MLINAGDPNYFFLTLAKFPVLPAVYMLSCAIFSVTRAKRYCCSSYKSEKTTFKWALMPGALANHVSQKLTWLTNVTYNSLENVALLKQDLELSYFLRLVNAFRV